MADLTTFGKRVRRRREEIKMSQQELADRLGYAGRSSVNKIEMGKSDMPWSKLLELADNLLIDPSELLAPAKERTVDPTYKWVDEAKDKALLMAYHKHPELQAVIDKILDIN